MSTGIAVTPERLREISTQLSAGTAEIDVILFKIASEVAALRTEWVGPARTQFGTLWEQLQADAYGLHSVLTGIAELTQRAASAYEAAEKAIAKSFTELRVELQTGPEQLEALPVSTPTVHADVKSEQVPEVDVVLLEDVQPAEPQARNSFGKELAMRAGRKTLK